METCAAFGGVSYDTLNEWMKKGERLKRGKFFNFSESIKKAKAQAELLLVERIHDHGEKEWQANAWILERRHPERWGRRERHEHAGKVDVRMSGLSQTTVEEIKKQILGTPSGDD